MRATIILGLISLMVWLEALSVYAGGADNLLRNVNFTPEPSKPETISQWTIVPAQSWDRHELVSFHGQPFEMFALRRHGEGQLVQRNIAVKSNTWYALGAWYRGEALTMDLTAPNGPGHPGSQAMTRFGSAEDWLPIRGYICSGSNAQVDFVARFDGAGESEIGRCELRELTEADAMTGPYIFDGNFENSHPGGRPLDFWGRPNEPQPVIAEDGNYPGGKLTMKITLEPGKPGMFLFGPCLPPLLKPGATVHIALWAKASRTGVSLFSNVGGAGWGDKVGFELTPEWQSVKQTLTVPPVVLPASLTRLFLIGMGVSNAATTIWIDNISISTEPPKEQETQAVTGKNPVLNGSFESGFYGWLFRFAGGVLNDEPKYEKPGRVLLDQSTAAEGQCSLRIEVPPGLDTSPLGFGMTSVRFRVEPDETYTISFWAKADGPGRIDAQISPGSQKASGGTVALTPEWKRYTVAAIPTSLGSDSKIMLCFRMNKPGTYWIDGIQIEKGKQAGDYQPHSPLEIGATVPDLFKVYGQGEKHEALVTLCSRLGKPAKLNFSCDFTDWTGRIINTVRQAVVVAPDKTNSLVMPLPTDRFGTIIAKLKLADPQSKQSGTSDFIYGVFPEPRAIDPEKSWFGIYSGSMMLYQDRAWLILPGGTLDDLFRLIRRVGFLWEAPLDLGVWRTLEAQPGKWRWPDMYVETALRNGVKLKPNIVNSLFGDRNVPAWAKSGPEIKNDYYGKINIKGYYPKMDAWTNFIGKFLAHYPTIDAIEIFGETGGAEPGPYVEYVKAAKQTAQKINPRVRIVGPGYPCQGMPYGPNDNTWPGQVMKAGLYEWIDVYSPHFYPPASYGDKMIEAYVDAYGSLEQILANQMSYFRSAYGNKPVWDTETGQCGRSQYEFAPSYGGYEYVNAVSPRVQAERFVRWSVMQKAAGVSRLFYHIFPLINISGWGAVHEMFDCDFSPNPKVSACAQLARQTELSTFVRKITKGKATWIYQFEVEDEKTGSKHPLIIYWNYETPDEAQIRVPLAAPDIRVEDMMGNRLEPEAKDGWVILPLDSGVHYVISDRLKGDDLMKAFEQGLVRGTTPALVNVALCTHDQRPAIAVGVLNMQDRPISGEFKITDLPRNWRMATNSLPFNGIAAETETANYGYFDGQGTEANPGFHNGLTGMVAAVGKFADDDKIYTARREIALATAEKKAGAIVIDGNLDEAGYGKAETLVLGKPEQSKHTPTGPSTNASATVKIAWDQDAVYFGIQVRDASVVNDAADNLLWQGDCVELYLDTAPDRDLNDHKYNTHQGKIVCAPGTRPGQKARLLFCKTPGGELENIDMKKVEAVSCKTDIGYNLEIMIPVKDRKLSAPTIWGFDISLINGKETQWLWVGGQEVWSNPHAWGSIMFTASGKPNPAHGD